MSIGSIKFKRTRYAATSHSSSGGGVLIPYGGRQSFLMILATTLIDFARHCCSSLLSTSSLFWVGVVVQVHTVASSTKTRSGHVLISKGGNAYEGNDSFMFHAQTNTLYVEKLNSEQFVGSVLDMNGASIINAALYKTTLDDITHLTLDTLGVSSLGSSSSSSSNGGTSSTSIQSNESTMVVSNARGLLSSIPNVRFDYKTNEFKVSSISSYGQSNILKLNANVNMGGYVLSNFQLQTNTKLSNITLDHVVIVNSILLKNVTALANSFHLQDAIIKDHLKILSLRDAIGGKGMLLTIDQDGTLSPVHSIRVSSINTSADDDVTSSTKGKKNAATVHASNETLIIETTNGVLINHGKLDLNNNEIHHATITNGSIIRDIKMEHIQSISSKEIKLLIEDDETKSTHSKSSISSGKENNNKPPIIVVMDQDDGTLMPLLHNANDESSGGDGSAAIELSNDGKSIKYGRITGSLYFDDDDDDNENETEDPGMIYNANLMGGTMNDINYLNVTGHTYLGSSTSTSDDGDDDKDEQSQIHMMGNVHVDGLLTVTGTVFASGPYVDMSDKRMKTNIQSLDGSKSLKRVMKLRGVSYDMKTNDEYNNTVDAARTAAEHQQQRQLGFIAQEVNGIFPELIFTTKINKQNENIFHKDENEREEDTIMGVQYSRLVPVLVECIKELNTEIETLKKQMSNFLKNDFNNTTTM